MGTRLLTAGIGIAVALIVLLLHNTFVLPLAAGIIAVCMLLELLHVNNLLRYHLSAVCALGYALILPMLQTGIEARYQASCMTMSATRSAWRQKASLSISAACS